MLLEYILDHHLTLPLYHIQTTEQFDRHSHDPIYHEHEQEQTLHEIHILRTDTIVILLYIDHILYSEYLDLGIELQVELQLNM